VSQQNFALTLSLRLKLDVALGLSVQRNILVSLGRRQELHLPLVLSVKLDVPICTKLKLSRLSLVTFKPLISSIIIHAK